MGRPSGSAALVLVDATTPLRVEPALFAAMLEGWRRQHVARPQRSAGEKVQCANPVTALR